MIEHVSISVRDLAKSKKFYNAAPKSLGYKLYRDYPPMAAGYLQGGSTSFWIAKQKRLAPGHVAFGAKSKKAVQAFHKAGLKAGGKDNGGPGFRLDYGDDYYAAFLYDPDGNNIEACYFGAKAPKKHSKKK